MRWLKSELTEDFITSFGVEADYKPDINVADFRPGWRQRNWGRLDQKLSDESLLDLAESMEANHGIPAGILYRFPDGLEPVDGHYRYGAAIDLHDATRVAGHILRNASLDVARKMAVSANPRSTGKSPTDNDIRKAAYDYLDSGHSTKETASGIGRGHKKIEEFEATRRNARIMEDAGFVVTISGRNGVLAELDRLGDDDKLKCYVFGIIEKAKYAKDEAKKCIKEIASQPVESRLATAQVFSKKPEVQARMQHGSSKAMPPIAVLISQMKGVRTTLLKSPELTLSKPAEIQAIMGLRETIHDYTSRILDRSGEKVAG